MISRKSLIIPVVVAVAAVGCESAPQVRNPFPNATNTQKGAAIGAVSGAAVGAAVDRDKRGRGALIGAIGGGLAGAGVGMYMDKQRQDLEKVLAAERQAGVIDIDKMANHTLKVTMTSQSAFDVDSATVKPSFFSTIDKMANVMNRYGKTALTIVGHTDNTGSAQHNQALSRDRAQAVEQAFMQRAVKAERLSSYGRGEAEPIASNATESGRAQNRRVEIIVEPIVEG